jgi:hypothetical protein
MSLWELSGNCWSTQFNATNLLVSNQLTDVFNLDAVNEGEKARVATLLSKHCAIVLTDLSDLTPVDLVP